MKFELTETLKGLTDEELLIKLSGTARSIGRDTITMEEFNKYGSGHAITFTRRFGSWPCALERAGLQPSRSKIGISEAELFDNLREVWISYGRRPKYSEVKAPRSRFSAGTYENRFGSWLDALRAFVEWAKLESDSEAPHGETSQANMGTKSTSGASSPKRTQRQPSERHRFRILMRDGFRCTSCGASPISTPGTELHVDHIVPWSRGGETEDENLTTKCKRCNLGKGNLEETLTGQ